MLKRILIVFFIIAIIFSFYKFVFHKRNTVDHIVIVTMDTTRADHFRCYGYPQNTTPFIDKIAAQGILYEKLHGIVGLTLPMHSTIMTGMTPASHAVHLNNMHRLHQNRTTLAELFQKKKYATAAFVSSFILNGRFGLNQGFQLYQDTFKVSRKGSPRLPLERQATETASEALAWMSKHKKEQFFIWIHFYDPHFTYDPPEPFNTAFKENLYDGEIAYTDYWVGKIWEQLRRQSDNYLFILTADHGESMGQHEEETHGFFAYQAQLAIPLIIQGPHLPKGVRVKEVVRSIDIAPTVCKQAGLFVPESMEGINLLDFESSRRHMPVYQESWTPTGYKWAAITAWTEYPWKYIDLPRPELYNLEEDPNELNNLYGTQNHNDTAQKLQSILRGYLEERKGSNYEVANIDLDPQTLDQLRSLGYVSGKVTLDEVTKNANNADPKDKILVFRKYQRAQSAVSAERHDLAIKLYKEIAEEEPLLPKIHLDLALAYNEAHQYDEALNEAQLAFNLEPTAPDAEMLMGDIEEEKGNINKTIQHYQSALKKSPKNIFIRSRLGEVFIKDNNFAEAEEYFKTALKFSPKHPYILNNLGYIYIKQNQDFDKGIALIRKADEFRSDDGLIKESLGSALLSKGDYVEAQVHLERAYELLGNEPRIIGYLKEVYTALKMDSKVHEMNEILSEIKNKTAEGLPQN